MTATDQIQHAQSRKTKLVSASAKLALTTRERGRIMYKIVCPECEGSKLYQSHQEDGVCLVCGNDGYYYSKTEPESQKLPPLPEGLDWSDAFHDAMAYANEHHGRGKSRFNKWVYRRYEK